MPTVLIVDGFRDLVDSLAHELTLNRWRVVGANTLEEARRVAGGIQVDVVLTDELLPEGKGVQLEDAFRAEVELRHTPFVYMVSSASVSQTLQGKCVLAKPFTLDQALEKLTSAAGFTARASGH